MTKWRSVLRCGECGGKAPQWVGRCPSGGWNTLVEEACGGRDEWVEPVAPGERAVPMSEVGTAE